MNMRVFFVRLTALLLAGVFLLIGNAHVSFADDVTMAEAFFTRREEYSGVVQVPGKGPMRYYAQNDPLWGALVYERARTESRRTFRDGGCGPTACAMAVANLITEEELAAISAHAKQPYSLCICSINSIKCEKNHARYVLSTQRDFVRFLPLAIADYATGNNMQGTISRNEGQGTSTGFMFDIADIYRITVTKTSDVQAALQYLAEGATVVCHAAREGAFTNTGHYILLAHADDEKAYFLDPLCRSVYDTRRGKRIEIIQPGLVALSYENLSAANLTMFFVFQKNTPDAEIVQ